MTLSPRHDARPVSRAAALMNHEPTVRDALASYYGLQGESGGRTEREAFAKRYMSLRDELAWRAAQGGPLTEVERATLLALDSVLDSLEPPLPTLPDEVQEIVRDVLRTKR
jgi:hypothetical protein